MADDRWRVLLVVEREANREQLAAWLSERYAVETLGDRPVADALDRCDLCLVDGASFQRVRGAVAAGTGASEPVFLPCLLVLTDGSPSGLREDAWDVVDDVIETPVRQAEFRGRVEVLLRARRYSLDLKRQNDRLERFADVVSHDLRNPLEVALGYLDAARESGDPDHFDRVDRALHRMDEIVDDVLTLARTGTVVEETAPLDLADAADTAWQTVATGGATLDVRVDGRVRVRGDETRVVELFENLFRNAVEHGSTSPRSQTPEDSVEHGSTGSRPEADDTSEHDGTDVTIRVGTLDDGAGFYVADDGPGIPESEREDVFEYGHTTADEGTGFGLAIVREIVRAHGWSIRVTDAAEGGARFEIACETTRETPPNHAGATPDEGGRDE